MPSLLLTTGMKRKPDYIFIEHGQIQSFLCGFCQNILLYVDCSFKIVLNFVRHDRQPENICVLRVHRRQINGRVDGDG